MKKLLILALALLLVTVIFAADRNVTDYMMHGKTDVDMFRGVLEDSSTVAGPLIRASIDTNSQFQFRPIAVQMTIPSDDTVRYNCFTVPAGKTATIRAVTLSAAVEMNSGANTVELEIINVNVSGSDHDTLVTKFNCDDGALAYNNVALALTLTTAGTTALGAGDIVQYRIYSGGAMTSIGEAAMLMFDVDFDE